VAAVLIRMLIKKHPQTMQRVRWVITLHSPHTGSELARTPQVVEQEIRRLIEEELVPGAMEPPPGVPLPNVKEALADQAVAAFRPLLRMLDDQLSKEDRELAPDSKVMRELAAVESKLDGASYHTFGGTEPNYARIYSWLSPPAVPCPIRR